MSDLKYNDNELLYLISQHNEVALELLLKKYTPLIKRRLHDFRIKSWNYDDFYQECLITFFAVIKKFREEKNGIFNLYLDYAIKNKIKSILRKEQKYFYNVSLTDDLDYLCSKKDEDRDIIGEPKTGILSTFEKDVFECYFKEGLKIEEIADSMLCDTKKIYNALSRIKMKMNKKVSKENNNKDVLIENLSVLENAIYKLYLDGLSTRAISLKLGCSFSKVSNALSRAKRKVKTK